MHKIFNKNLHIHVKVREKRYPVNIGLIFIVILASLITWFLTEYIVYELNEMDMVAIEWVSEVRPRVLAQSVNGILRVHPTNSRYFTDNSGKAIYLTSAYTGNVLQDQDQLTDDFDLTNYVNYLNEHDINLAKYVIRDRVTASPSIYLRTGPGIANDGKSKFDLDQFNPEFFNRLRSRTSYLEVHNIYVDVMFFNGFDVKKAVGWANSAYNLANNINNIDGDTNNDGLGNEVQTWPLSPEIEQLERTRIRKIIDEVNDFDNIIYEVCNEAYYDSQNWQYWVINEIKSYELTKPKQHLIGMTVESPGGNNDDLFSSNADWVSPEAYNIPPLADGSQIIISDSDHWDPMNMTPAQVWMSFTRGVNPMSIEKISSSDWSLNLFDVHDNMQYTENFADRMDLANMIPSDRSNDCSTTYCLRDPGQEYLVYQPNSGSFTVNLIAGDYNYEWFNPDTGSVAQTGTITASGGNRTFTPPFSGDAVLYLKIAAAPTCTDADGDHYYAEASGCSGQPGFLGHNDCNDSEKYAYPGGTETCDTIDNNCNGETDEDCDNDNDKYCDKNMKVYRNNSMCPSTPFIDGRDGDDCDDSKNTINPGASEICGNGVDENCDGADQACLLSGLSPGVHNISLTVTDNSGKTATDNITITVSSDTVNPRVSVFDVQPRTTNNAITASYTVTDNKNLNRIELWRAPDAGGAPDQSAWTQVSQKAVSGTSGSGTLTDNPLPAGTYWYGLHAVDTAGNVGYEPNPPGPVKITVPLQTGFIHPGLLNNRAELNLMKAKVAAHEDPWYTGYQQIPSYLNYNPQAVVDYIDNCVWDQTANPSRYALNDDSKAVYASALQWVVTGNDAHAQKAIEIINNWSYTLKSIQQGVAPDGGYCEGYLLYTSSLWPRFIFAAEIIRSTYSGWSQTDQDQFENMLLNLVYPNTQAVCHSCSEGQKNNGLNNWGALGTLCRMSIAVYTDNQNYFDGAVNDYKKLIEASFKSDGQNIETCRCQTNGGCTPSCGGWCNYDFVTGGGDMWHTQMSLGSLTGTAEIAKKQGVNLYDYSDPVDNNSLLTSLVYHAPFVGFPTRGDNSTWPCETPLDTIPTGSGNFWEMANNHYNNSVLNALIIELDRPEKSSQYWGGWGTLTHTYTGA